MEIRKSKPTIKLIASKAGVSLATVSNALNGRRGVNEETSKQVLDIARELGYFDYSQKSPINKALRDIRAIRVIKFRKHGLVVQDTPFFSELLNGIENECSMQGFELLFSQVQAWEKEDRKKFTQLLQDEQVANIILATEMGFEDLELIEQAKAPLVLLDSYFCGTTYNSVAINNYEAGFCAARYLIERGHQQIGIINSSTTFNNMYYRWSGYRDALVQSGLPVRPELEVRVEPTIKGSYRDMKIWLSSEPSLPTAFFAANDMMAAGSVRAMQEKGLCIPDDISIVGMDNTPICQAVSPALTTVHVYKQELAAAAVKELLAIIKSNQKIHRLVEVGVKMVERSSTSIRLKF